MELNVLLRGQSNALLFADHAGWAAPVALQREVERLLGFDGVANKVKLHIQWGDSTSTIHSGTSFLKEWMTKDGSGQWVAGNLERSLLGYIAQDMTAAQRANPTAVFWLHSEYDSTIQGLDAADWAAAVSADAALVRGALGQGASTVPYAFVSAHPYWGKDASHQAIREGMEILASDAGFNGHIAARALDLDIDNDNYDGNGATREYGGSHISASDARLIAGRAAKAIAEAFAAHALPGSPVAQAGGNIADEGPQVVAARITGSRTIEVDVRHDQASGFAGLDADAARGVGWSLRDAGGGSVYATGAAIVDGDTLRLSFGSDLPAGGTLHYGYGYGRLAAGKGPGQGNAVYDSAGLPIWTPAAGVKLGGATSGGGDGGSGGGGAVSLTAGSGPDTLVLKLSQDRYQGDAQYTVKVDGVQVGGTFTASALHDAGQSDTLTLKGDWAAGPHRVEVNFLNDAWGGSSALDRNLHIDGASYNGTAIGGVARELQKSGPSGFGFTDTESTTAPGGAVSLTAGSGPDTLVLKLSQDRYQGDAQYTVKVDGVQVGGTFTASALHDAGQSDTLTLKGDWAAGPHRVEVNFLNDAWGGSGALDRNLHIDGASYNGTAIGGVARELQKSGPSGFGFTDTESTTAPGGAVSLTAGSGPDTLVLKLSQDRYQGDAQYTVKVDGVQVGGTFTASALHDAGQSDTLTLKGDWAAGAHRVEVNFLNDAWGGSGALDRNLHIDAASYNGTAIGGVARELQKSGPSGFGFTDTAGGSGGGDGGGEFSSTVTWGDEFNGTALDGSKWPILYGGSLYWNGAFRWDRSEVSVGNGNLTIGLEKQSDGIWDVGGLSTTPSSWAPGFSMLHGKVEIRAKASEQVVGAGPCFLLWPATNDHWPPEVDILETPKGQGMFTNHWQGPGGNNDDRYEATTFDLDYSQWHVYGLEWTPDRLTMTVDGKVVKTLTTNIPTEAMSIGLQGHVGAAADGWYGGSPNGSGVGAVDISVDYVRVYDYLG